MSIKGNIIADICGDMVGGIVSIGGGVVTTVYDLFKEIPAALTFARSGTARYKGWEGKIREAADGEAPHVGSRRVENLVSANFNTGWTTFVTGDGSLTISPDGTYVDVSITSSGRAVLIHALPSRVAGQSVRLSASFSNILGAPFSIRNIATTTGETFLALNTSSDSRISPDVGVYAASGATDMRLGIGTNTTETGGPKSFRIMLPQAENVTGQSNKNPSSFVDGVGVYDTLNANTVDSDGVVTERVGAKIDQRKVFDGTDQYLTIPDVDFTSTDELLINATLDSSAVGNNTLIDYTSVGGFRMAVIVNAATGSITLSGGVSVYIDGSASPTTAYPLDGLPHNIRVTSSIVRKISHIGSDFNGANTWYGSIWDLQVVGIRHYKLDELTGTVAVDSISGQNGTYVNMSDPLPLLDPVMLGAQVEEERENIALRGRDMTNGVWAATNITPLQVAGIGADCQTASRLTASAANGTIFQSLTVASAVRCYSAHVRRHTGTGTVEMTMDGGTTYTDITSQLSAALTRIHISQTLANPSIGFRIVTSGDVIEVDYNQLEAGDFPTSEIETGAATVTRNAATLTGAIAFPANTITAALEWYPSYDSGDFKDADGSNNAALLSLQGASVANLFELAADDANDDFSLQKLATDAGSDSLIEGDLGSYAAFDKMNATIYAGTDAMTLTVNTEPVNTTSGANATAGWPTNQLTDITIGSRKDGSRPASGNYKQLTVTK